MEYINITEDNIDAEHLCCAIGDPKHQDGVNAKKEWLKDRIKEGHVFRKLNQRGKVFIEYAPLEKSWVPISGDNYNYIYCLWVAGSYKGSGHAKALIEYAINDAKKNNKNGICVISSKKKKPFFGEKAFFLHYGFKVVDSIDDFELLALNFNSVLPSFNQCVKKMSIEKDIVTIYYSPLCPYTLNSINEIKECAKVENIDVDIINVNTLEKAKEVPCIFNAWATFKDSKFVSNTILNKNSFLKLIK